MNDGDPAFPGGICGTTSVESYCGPTQSGMSLWHYYAAHAPSEVHAWFRPLQHPIPRKPEGAEWCGGCKADSDCEETGACLAMHEHAAREITLNNANKRWSYFQWRFEYADGMIAEAERRKNLISTPQQAQTPPDTANKQSG